MLPILYHENVSLRSSKTAGEACQCWNDRQPQRLSTEASETNGRNIDGTASKSAGPTCQFTKAEHQRYFDMHFYDWICRDGGRYRLDLRRFHCWKRFSQSVWSDGNNVDDHRFLHSSYVGWDNLQKSQGSNGRGGRCAYAKEAKMELHVQYKGSPHAHWPLRGVPHVDETSERL